MAKDPTGAPSPNRLLVCVLINQLATPGLGSWMARRRIAGAAQLILSISGFVLVVLWMCESFYSVFGKEMDWTDAAPPADWMCKWGWILFGAGWLWALLTSLSMLFQARRMEKSNKVPPRISNPPSGPSS